MKKFLLALLLALIAIPAGAQNQPFTWKIEYSGSRYYIYFHKDRDYPYGLTINYRVHFPDGFDEDGIATILTNSYSDRSTSGYPRNNFWVEILSWNSYDGSYGGSSASYSSYDSSSVSIPQPPSDKLFLSVSTGYGVSYGGAWGIKAKAHIAALGLTAGYGIAPTMRMPNTFSFGAQLNFWDCYFDFQYAGKRRGDPYMAFTWGSDDFWTFGRENEFYGNFALGVCGYGEQNPKFLFEFGVGYKILRSH